MDLGVRGSRGVDGPSSNAITFDSFSGRTKDTIVDAGLLAVVLSRFSESMVKVVILYGKVHLERFQDPAKYGVRKVSPDPGVTEHLDVDRVTHGQIELRERHGNDKGRGARDEKDFKEFLFLFSKDGEDRSRMLSGVMSLVDRPKVVILVSETVVAIEEVVERYFPCCQLQWVGIAEGHER